MKLFKNKKGNIEDVMTSVSWIFLLVVIIIFGSNLLDKFDTQIQANVHATDESKDFLTKFIGRYDAAWDYGIIFLALGFIIVSALAARFIPSDPIFLAIGTIFIIFIVFMCAIMGNVWDDMMLNNADLAARESSMTFLPFLMDNLIGYAIIYFVIVGYILYSRKGSET
jgi:hypothetical protein|tara:strand:- start:10293 stop:10796 length:504 start_codon:yes stop_codon:yes gene_type:complete